MTLGPVHWGSYSGDFLERLMAVLVAQDEPDVIRRTPASGDGGIDLLVPNDAGYSVAQVKGFTGRLGSSQRRQISKSWASVATRPRLGRPITRYDLVVPLDPTPDEQAWFEELTDGSDYPVHFRGQPHWDSLAAKHPHVIDYMIGGGRDRIRERAKVLLSATADSSQPIGPQDVAVSLDLLRSRLNLEDPHFRYEFATSAQPPDSDLGADCVLAETRQMTDGGFLSILVFKKHQYSLDDEPIVGSLTVRIENPSEARAFNEALQGFTELGRAVDVPDGALFVDLELPGGLRTEVIGGSGRIGPALVESPPATWRVAVRDPNGRQIDELSLTTTTLTRGQAGGAELHAQHSSGVVELKLVLYPPAGGTGQLKFDLILIDPTGSPVRDVLAPVRFLSLLKTGHEVVLLPAYGPEAIASHTLEADAGLVPADFALHLEDLATVQEFASFPIPVPEDVETSFARDLHSRARMLRGEVLSGTWDQVTLNLKPDADRGEVIHHLQEGGQFVIGETWLMEFDGGEVDLGVFSLVLDDVKVASEQPDDDGQIRLIPNSSHSMTQRRGSASFDIPATDHQRPPS